MFECVLGRDGALLGNFPKISCPLPPERLPFTAEGPFLHPTRARKAGPWLDFRLGAEQQSHARPLGGFAATYTGHSPPAVSGLWVAWEIWVTLMNFFINKISEKCYERCRARPNHLWAYPKCSLGAPGPHLSGSMLLWRRPGRGNPFFWPLGAGIPRQTKKRAEKAPNLNQQQG